MKAPTINIGAVADLSVSHLKCGILLCTSATLTRHLFLQIRAHQQRGEELVHTSAGIASCVSVRADTAPARHRTMQQVPRVTVQLSFGNKALQVPVR